VGERTAIEWTDATWNPTTGCTKVSAGCDHCYAHVLAHGRLHDVYTRRLPVLKTGDAQHDPFAVRLWPERLEQPAKWLEPRMIFVNSMSDLFHADVPDDYVRRIFQVMLRVDRHTYQVLTKRPSRAQRFVRKNADLFTDGIVPDHIWMGTSVENQDVVYRADHLRRVPATTRFLSCEPLLGPLELDLDGIRWVIVGGESGLGYRPMRMEWATGIRDQCKRAGVPFFFKQWGGRTPKAGGRFLSGRTWDELPFAPASIEV
jgi:protein gp37